MLLESPPLPLHSDHGIAVGADRAVLAVPPFVRCRLTMKQNALKVVLTVDCSFVATDRRDVRDSASPIVQVNDAAEALLADELERNANILRQEGSAPSDD